MVRDVVTRSVVAHFRAHTSPLHVLDFDPSGTLLVTASVHGHSIHIFQIRPPAGGRSGGGSCGIPCMGSALHLFRYGAAAEHSPVKSGMIFLQQSDMQLISVATARLVCMWWHSLWLPQARASACSGMSSCLLSGGHALIEPVFHLPHVLLFRP